MSHLVRSTILETIQSIFDLEGPVFAAQKSVNHDYHGVHYFNDIILKHNTKVLVEVSYVE